MCRKTYKLRIHIQSRLAELLPRIFIIVFLAARAFTYIFSFWPPCQFWKYGCPCAKRCCSIRHLPELRGRYWVWYGDLVGGLRDLRAIDPLHPPAIPLPKPPLHSPSTVPFTSPLPLEPVQSNHENMASRYYKCPLRPDIQMKSFGQKENSRTKKCGQTTTEEEIKLIRVSLNRECPNQRWGQITELTIPGLLLWI